MDLERGDRIRPFDAGLVMEGLDDGAYQPAGADPVGPHVHVMVRPIGPATTAFIGAEYLVPK